MSKQHYFFKLIPPRPTFMRDITDEERRLMGFFCSVRDGKRRSVRTRCAEVDTEEGARQFGEGDPSVSAGLNKFEIHPMRVFPLHVPNSRDEHASCSVVKDETRRIRQRS